MRSLTGNTETKSQTHLGTEPVIIIKVQWDSSTAYYADKDISFGGIVANGRILEFSPVSSTGKQDSAGEVSSASVTLDDTDGSLKHIVNTEIIEGTTVTVYHHYVGLAESDLVVLLHGKAVGDIDWNEGERILTFGIESYIDDAEVGYTGEQCSPAGVNVDAQSQMWPICFGTCLKVPAVGFIKSPYGHSTEGIYGGWPYLDSVPFEVENGDMFPQETELIITVGTTIFRGSFSGTTFNRTESNLVWWYDMPISARPDADVDGDTDKRDIVYIPAGYDLTDKWCYHPDLGFNLCDVQQGNKAYFRNNWPSLLDDSHTFAEVRGCGYKDWYEGTSSWLNYWYVYPSKLVGIHNQSTSDLYIVNQYPSNQILEVYGWRSYGDDKIFVPIPTSYYTKHLSYDICGEQVTAIEFPTPLESRTAESWDGDVYVSLRSSLPSNVSDIIKWILETYTSFGIDTASFSEVQALTNAYPCGFALFDKRNVIDLIEDIAWQARCAVYIHDGQVSIKYLSYDMPTTYYLGEDDVLFKTLNLSFTSTDDLITRLEGDWQLDYSGRAEYQKKMTYSNNVDEFGLKPDTREFYIYNIEELVKMSLYFWGYRYSNSWRIIEAVTFLKSLGFEVYDAVTSVLQIFSTNNIKGMLEELSHDTSEIEIAIKMLMASKSGDHSGGQPIEDQNFWLGDPAYPVESRTITIPGTNHEVDYEPPVIVDTENNDSGDSEDNTTNYKFQFHAPEIDQEIERNTDFEITINLYYDDGRRAYLTTDAILSIHNVDSADTLSLGDLENEITLVNGSYSISTAQITGGSGVDYSFLSVVDKSERDNFEPDTVTVKIIDDKTGTLTWDTEPSGTIGRYDQFSVAISGGTGGAPETITVQSLLSDPDDGLQHDDGTPVTTIELDAAGEYTGNWYIDGGAGTDTGNRLVLKDEVNNKYADAPTSDFTIGGLSTASITQSLSISDNLLANEVSLSVTLLDGTLDNGSVFHLQVALEDSEGNVIDYDTPCEISIADANGTPMYWLQPQASVLITDAMVTGLALGAGDDCEVQVATSNTSPATVTASIVYNGQTITGTLELVIPAQNIIEQALALIQEIITVAPSSRVLDQRMDFSSALTTRLNSAQRLSQLLGIEQTLQTIGKGENLIVQSLDASQDVTAINERYIELASTLYISQAVSATRTMVEELVQAVRLDQETSTPAFSSLIQVVELLQELTVNKGYLGDTQQDFSLDQYLEVINTADGSTTQALEFTQVVAAIAPLTERIVQTLEPQQQTYYQFPLLDALTQTLTIAQELVVTNTGTQLIQQALEFSQSVGNLVNRPQAVSQLISLSQEVVELYGNQEALLQEIGFEQLVATANVRQAGLEQSIELLQTVSGVFENIASLSQSLALEQEEGHEHIYFDSFDVVPSVTSTTKGTGYTFDITVTAKDNLGGTVLLNDTINISLRLRTNHSTTPTETISISTLDLVDGEGTATGVYIDGGTDTDDLDATIKADYSGVEGFGDIYVYASRIEPSLVTGNYLFEGYDDYVDDTEPYSYPTCAQWTSLASSAASDCAADSTGSYGSTALVDLRGVDATSYYGYVALRSSHDRAARKITLTASDIANLTSVRVTWTADCYRYNGSYYANWSENPNWRAYFTQTAPTSGNFTGGTLINSGNWGGFSGTSWRQHLYYDFPATVITAAGDWYIPYYFTNYPSCNIDNWNYVFRMYIEKVELFK